MGALTLPLKHSQISCKVPRVEPLYSADPQLRDPHISALRSRFAVSTVYQLSTDTADCVTVSPTVAQYVCLSVSLSVCRYSFMLHTVVCACKYICMCICVSFAVVVDGHLLAALLASVWLPFYAPQMKMQTDNGRQRRLRIWLRERTTTTRTTTSDDDVALLKTMAATAVGAVRWQHGHMPHAACRMPLCSIHFLHAFEL